MNQCIFLEKEARQISAENARPPLPFQLPPALGRAALSAAQDAPVCLYPADISHVTVDTGRWGRVPTALIAPKAPCRPSGVIFYIHGGGWVFGSLHTHKKLVCELAARTGRLVVFPEYSLSPEAKYPTALEQCYAVLCQLPVLLQQAGLGCKPGPLSVAGDSAGGNLATVLALLALQRGGPAIDSQLLYYPVTNFAFDTPSYHAFACGYSLYRAGMQWFWRQYLAAPGQGCEYTASPLRAPLGLLSGLPRTMIVNGEADVLRDDGAAYARRLCQAGVSVTRLVVSGTIHDFVMLNALNDTNACRIAMDASVGWLCRTDRPCPAPSPR